jgi:hypothetical protein
VTCISRIGKHTIAAAIPAALSLFGVAANAQTTVFDSTNGFNSSLTGPIIAMYEPGYGQSFSTGATESTLTSVTLGLYRGNQTGSSINVLLFSDSGTKPGTLLDTVGSISEALLTTTPTLYKFAPGSTVTLAANTRYWVMLTGGTTQHNGNYGALQADNPDLTGLESSQEYQEVTSRGHLVVFKNTTLGMAPVMKISVDPFDPVTPEPGSVALLAGLAVSGGAVLRRRHKNRE